MKGATEAAKRLKLLFSALRNKLGKVQPPPATDAITQLILGVFSRDMPESKAREVLELLRGMVVDYNELRVIPPLEMSRYVGDYPECRIKCEDLTRALNRIFAQEHTTGLDRLREVPRKEAQAYLERIDGLEAYTRARIRLLGLGQHAVPLDEAMWHAARVEKIIDPKCSLEEAQAFLERQIPEEQAIEFFALFRRYAWNEHATAVKKRAVRVIRSVPPDRTSRNMLQMLQTGQVDELPDPTLDEEGLLEPPLADEPRKRPPKVGGARKADAATKPADKPKSEKPKAEKTKSEKGAGAKPSAAGVKPSAAGAKADAPKLEPPKPGKARSSTRSRASAARARLA